MSDDADVGGEILPREMSLLLFHAAGVAMGVEASAVEGILDAEQARQAGIACRDLAEQFGTPGTGAAAPAKKLLLKKRGAPRGIGIDSLDEIVAVPTADLQILPEPLASFRGPRPFWGCIVRENRVVLLVDVDRLREPAEAIGEALL